MSPIFQRTDWPRTGALRIKASGLKVTTVIHRVCLPVKQPPKSPPKSNCSDSAYQLKNQSGKKGLKGVISIWWFPTPGVRIKVVYWKSHYLKEQYFNFSSRITHSCIIQPGEKVTYFTQKKKKIRLSSAIILIKSYHACTVGVSSWDLYKSKESLLSFPVGWKQK